MDNIDGKYYFTCITNGCHVGGPHKISENLVRLETERQLKHVIIFHNVEKVYGPNQIPDLSVDSESTFSNDLADKLGN